MQQNKDGELKQYKLFGLFSLVSIFLVTSLCGGSFENFKKTQNTAFDKYRDKNDLAFSNYLKEAWQEYKAQASPPLYKKEKPKKIHRAQEKEMKKLGPLVNIKIPKRQQVRVVPKQKVSIVKAEPKNIHIDYFGQELGFNIDETMKDIHFYPHNQEGIVNFFNHMTSSQYNKTLQRIKELQKSLNLNDWGVYQLVEHLAKSLYDSTDEKKLFSWFMFNKLGYDVKIGIGKQHVQLMHYSKKVIYSTPRYTFGDKKYYVISAYASHSLERIYSYKQNYPNADKALDLELHTLPNFETNLEHKTVSFNQYGKMYNFTYSYDKNLIDFMATYPQADYETYFNSPLSSETYDEIVTQMKKYINTQHASQAINFVLKFVQKAFKYERDQEQFGREKVMFANETLYYNKSDCEDRAILFSYLVKKLFKISVIGVKYKDHMATALYIPMQGDSVKVGGRKFVIADPTYINANIGQSMPKYRSVIPLDYIILSKGK